MAKTTEQVKLTKTAVEDARPLVLDGATRQRLYLDTELKGFGLCVGARTKTFFAQRDVNGKTVRTTIGRYGVYTVAQARDEARALIMRMGKGVNPNREKEQRRFTGISYGEALTLHLGLPKKRSARTLDDYRYLSNQYLADWLKKPLGEFTRSECRERHQKIGKENGPSAANSTFRVFGAVYNSAMKVNEELGVNPVIGVVKFPEKRRKAAIPSNSVAAWYKEVMAMANPIRRDYLRFVLLTGLRRTSATVVEWDHVNLKARTLLIPNPKGGEERAFLLPLSDELIALLEARQTCETTKTFFPKSKWLFPANSKSGHITEPKENLDVKFTIHGLRNTFASIATSAERVNDFAPPFVMNLLRKVVLNSG